MRMFNELFSTTVVCFSAFRSLICPRRNISQRHCHDTGYQEGVMPPQLGGEESPPNAGRRVPPPAPSRAQGGRARCVTTGTCTVQEKQHVMTVRVHRVETEFKKGGGGSPSSARQRAHKVFYDVSTLLTFTPLLLLCYSFTFCMRLEEGKTEDRAEDAG